MSEPNDEQRWQALVGKIVAWRSGTGNNQHRQELAAIRRGGTAFTEVYAYPYVLPYADANEQARTALLRAVALIAEFPDIPAATQSESLGRALNRASWQMAAKTKASGSDKDQPLKVLDPKKPDAIASRLAILPQQDLENAVRTLRTVLSIVQKTGTPLDFYDLTRTLLRWGNGYSPASRAVRARILRDYYSAE